MALPQIVTIEDIDDIVAYLKTKPAGASIEDAKKVIRKQIFDHRKMPAYVAWDIISRDSNRLNLNEKGWHLARNTLPRHVVFQEILKSNPAYTSVLEWAFHSGLDEITSIDAGAHWHEHHKDTLGTKDEKGIKDRVNCFFRICEAAKLGKLVLGRKGQPTRLTLNKDNIELFIGAGLPRDESQIEEDVENDNMTDEKISEEVVANPKEEMSDQEECQPGIEKDRKKQVRVFISHGKNMELVEQVETMLGVAEIPYELAISEETSAIPVPEKVFNSMRKCNSAVIIVSVDEAPSEGETPTINQNVLIEIGAAFVLYNKKVILLWDKRIPIPSNLQGLYRSEFEGDELSWKSGMKLMKALKDFQGK